MLATKEDIKKLQEKIDNLTYKIKACEDRRKYDSNVVERFMYGGKEESYITFDGGVGVRSIITKERTAGILKEIELIKEHLGIEIEPEKTDKIPAKVVKKKKK